MEYHVENHGSVVLVVPDNLATLTWLMGAVNEEALWFGNALAVEPRYVNGLLAALEGDEVE